MVYVKLLKDVVQGGHLKTTLKTNRQTGKKFYIPFIEGTIITMHEASAKKYVEQGLGEIVENVPSTPSSGG